MFGIKALLLLLLKDASILSMNKMMLLLFMDNTVVYNIERKILDTLNSQTMLAFHFFVMIYLLNNFLLNKFSDFDYWIQNMVL